MKLFYSLLFLACFANYQITYCSHATLVLTAAHEAEPNISPEAALLRIQALERDNLNLAHIVTNLASCVEKLKNQLVLAKEQKTKESAEIDWLNIELIDAINDRNTAFATASQKDVRARIFELSMVRIANAFKNGANPNCLTAIGYPVFISALTRSHDDYARMTAILHTFYATGKFNINQKANADPVDGLPQDTRTIYQILYDAWRKTAPKDQFQVPTETYKNLGLLLDDLKVLGAK